MLQTPEMVRLTLLGGAQKTFRTADFLAQSLTVLSSGFALLVRFGIDGQHQACVTRDIPKNLTPFGRTVLVSLLHCASTLGAG
jgi:hypothetical protein